VRINVRSDAFVSNLVLGLQTRFLLPTLAQSSSPPSTSPLWIPFPTLSGLTSRRRYLLSLVTDIKKPEGCNDLEIGEPISYSQQGSEQFNALSVFSSPDENGSAPSFHLSRGDLGVDRIHREISPHPPCNHSRSQFHGREGKPRVYV
jgi:hypothetical protein